MTSGDCPSQAELLNYTVGLMPEVTAAVLEGHVLSCENCQTTLAVLDESADPLVGRLRNIEPAFEDEPDLAALVAELDKLAAVHPADDRQATHPQIGPYQLLAKIGQGGGGVVYSARHFNLGKVVALKLLSVERLHNPVSQARFVREMRAVGRLDHPHIVRALDAGRHDDQPYLAMELIDGVVVSRIASAAQRLRVPDACELIRQTALGLAAAHRGGLIHRDIKPSNLIVTNDGIVKILDLGLARFETPEDDESLTGEGRVVGTATYVAPEQALQDANVDLRADLYSAGATLFKLLAGQPPFSGADYDTPLKKVLGHVRDEPPRIEQLRPDLPGDLSALIDRLLAKSPSARLDSAAALAEALAPFAAGADLAALVRHVRSLPGPETLDDDTHRSFSGLTPYDVPAEPQPDAAKRRRWPKWPWIVAAGGTVIGALLLYSRDQSTVPRHAVGAANAVEQPAPPPADLPPPTPEVRREEEKLSAAELAKYQDYLAPRESHPQASVDAVAFSPDSKLVATGGSNAQLRIWNVSPWKSLAEIADYPFGQKYVKFFPDQTRVLTVETNPDREMGTARVWELPKDGQPAKLGKRFDSVRAADLSPDGTLLATVGYSKGLIVRDVASGKVVKEFSFEPCRQVRFSPDGKLVAVVDLRGRGQLFHTSDWSAQRYFAASGGPIRDVAISADGATLVTCGGADGRAQVTTWDAATLAERKVMAYDGPPAQQLALLPGGRAIVFGVNDDVLRIWDLERGQLIQRDDDRRQTIRSLTVSADGKEVLVGRLDGSIEISHVNEAGKLIESGHRKHPVAHKHREMILGVAFSPDSRLIATAAADGQIMISEITSGRMVLRLNVPKEGVGGPDLTAGGYYNAVTFSPDGTHVAAGGLASNAVRVWNVATGELEKTLPDGNQASAVEYSSDGRWLAVGGRNVAICDAASGKRLHLFGNFDADGFFCHSLHFSPDNILLAAGGEDKRRQGGGNGREGGRVVVWNAVSGEELYRISADTSVVTCVRFHPDGMRLAYGKIFDQTVFLCKATTGEPMSIIPVPESMKFAFSPDGTTIFAAGGCWDVASGRQLLASKGKENVFGLAVSPDGKYLATVRDKLLIEPVAEMLTVSKGKK